jgi:hypothetical protein
MEIAAVAWRRSGSAQSTGRRRPQRLHWYWPCMGHINELCIRAHHKWPNRRMRTLAFPKIAVMVSCPVVSVIGTFMPYVWQLETQTGGQPEFN